MRGVRHRNVSGSLIAIMVALAGAACMGARAQSATPPPAAARNVQAAQGGPTWQALTPQQRSALAPLQGDWHQIDANRKAKWLDIAGRFPKLPPQEQQRLQARMAEWSRLSPTERGQARLNYQEAKQLTPAERQAQWQAYQALPEDERKALANQGRPAAGSPPPASTKAPAPVNAPGTKRNIVANPSLSTPPGKPVGPTVVQAAPGATTTLVTRQASPPAHQQAGLPKIAATPTFVDRTTLLPKRGPQGAATRAAGASQPKAP